MLHYRTRRRLFSTLVLLVAYVTLLSPIAFVMIASFDYGQRAYVVFPPEQFTLRILLADPDALLGTHCGSACASRFCAC